MSSTHLPRIGIIGGLGNEAMVDLVEKIDAIKGADKRAFIAFGNSRLACKPDEVMQSWKPTDEPELRKADTAIYTLRFMQYLGADVMGLACNSAHDLFRNLLPEVPVTFVDMLHRTAHTIEGTQDKVLVMGVNSLVDSGLYQAALMEQGVASTKPSVENQQKVMTAIYDPAFGIKTAQITPDAEALLCDVIRSECEQQGCSKVVLGCTELPLALTAINCERFKQEGLIPESIDLIDASQVLAECLLTASGNGKPLDHTLDDFKGEHTDWFAPLTFKVTSLSAIARIQKEVFRHTVEFLIARGQSVTGSYLHLPTLFVSSSADDVEDKLIDMGIPVYLEHDEVDTVIVDALQRYYADMDKNLAAR
ncbi:aspartate/glutamate racemase family protein [Enterovibrio norvegicus]|uniref:aspartate/glutamate racemase family protein n=1 Tax=Enterovibrio norvegicus TaxID=188144 RepID=UPI0013D782A6|nr:aspartate/glutamate racemase family protein [Enterovibrio norvegicus]